jgi:hypothetical protein
MPTPSQALAFGTTNPNVPAAPTGDQNATFQGNQDGPLLYVSAYPQKATASLRGTVKPDGTTITVDGTGTISALQLSGPANEVLATPDGSSGTASLRALVAADIPSLPESKITNLVTDLAAKVPNSRTVNGHALTSNVVISASDLTTGTLPVAQLPIMVASGASHAPGAVPDPGATAGTTKFLREDATWATVTSPSAPPLRGSVAAAFGSGGSYTVSFPSGSAVGDFALLCSANTSGGITVPSGWTTLASDTSWGVWDGFVASRALTSGDIATGSVTVPVGGGAAAVIELVVFIGATGGVREVHGGVHAYYPSADVISTSSAVTSSDVGIFFTGAAIPTGGASFAISPGTVLSSVNVTAGLGVIADAAMPGGVSNVTFTGGAGGVNNNLPIDYVVIVMGVTSVGTVSSVGLTMPSDFTVSGSPVINSGTLVVTGGVTKSGIQQEAYTYAADTGTANAYAVAYTPAPTLVAGSAGSFKAANACTGASTLAVNGGTPIAIKKNGNSTALASGDIAANQIIDWTYDGTVIQILVPGSGGGTSPLTTKGDLYGFDTASNRIPVGADTQVLTADSSQTLGVKWAASPSGFANPMTTQGDIIYGGSSGTATRLAAGTSGNVLQTNGAGAAPTWVAPSGGGGANLFPGVAASGTIPDLSTWTAVNSGVLVSQNGGAGFPALFKVTNNASLNWRALKTTLPSTPYTIVVRLNGNRPFANSSTLGLYWFDAANKMAAIEVVYQASFSTPQLRIHKGTSPTNDTSDTPATAGFPDGCGYLALTQTATNQIYWYSIDGVNWIQLLSETTGTFMTPTGYGVGGIAAGTGDIYGSLTYFRQTASATP